MEADATGSVKAENNVSLESVGGFNCCSSCNSTCDCNCRCSCCEAGEGHPCPCRDAGGAMASPVSVRGAESLLQQQQCKLKVEDFETVATVGTGTFGRVNLVKEKNTKHYYALKIMSIPDVIRLKQEQHVHNEKEVLKEVDHPFLIRLFWTCHDDRFLYMLMEYVPGGELFSYLRNTGRFNNGTGLFYSAEIICAIEHLHSKEIVYRDLKPENILLDKEGHIKLTDFGFAKKLSDRTWTLCGTPEYLAPEVIQSKGHGRAVDWWALGILIFEMLAGFPPFFDDNPFGIYQKILAGKIDFPRHLDIYVKDLIKRLLVVDRTRRLGNMKNGAEDVKKHRWFRNVEWDAVPEGKLKCHIGLSVLHHYLYRVMISLKVAQCCFHRLAREHNPLIWTGLAGSRETISLQ